MREIKFRAWHKTDGWCGAFSVHQTGLIDYGSGWMTLDEAKMVLMQYTGLKDKNGREIYEGDIVRCMLDFGPAGEEERVLPVTITPFGCGPMMEWNYKEGMLPEVIGNIYENPNLIEL